MLAVLVATVAALAACDTNVGAAAKVGGDRISESDVNGYLTPAAAPFQNGQGQQVVPRSFVLQTLIRSELFSRGLAAGGGLPTPGQIADKTTQLLNGETEAALTQQIVKSGFAARFEPVYLRAQVLLQMYAERVKATSLIDVYKAVAKLRVPVSTNPRYGPWQAASLAIGPVELPGFVKLATPPARPAAG